MQHEVRFEEETATDFSRSSRPYTRNAQQPALTRLLLRFGVVKTDDGAKQFAVGLVIACLLLSGIIFFATPGIDLVAKPEVHVDYDQP